MRGTMLWFNEEKDYGFIKAEQDNERLYVHRSGFAPGEAPVGRCEGVDVLFERIEAEGDAPAQAVGVTIVGDAVAGRRARMHSHRNTVRQ